MLAGLDSRYGMGLHCVGCLVQGVVSVQRRQPTRQKRMMVLAQGEQKNYENHIRTDVLKISTKYGESSLQFLNYTH